MLVTMQEEKFGLDLEIKFARDFIKDKRPEDFPKLEAKIATFKNRFKVESHRIRKEKGHHHN